MITREYLHAKAMREFRAIVGPKIHPTIRGSFCCMRSVGYYAERGEVYESNGGLIHGVLDGKGGVVYFDNEKYFTQIPISVRN